MTQQELTLDNCLIEPFRAIIEAEALNVTSQNGASYMNNDGDMVTDMLLEYEDKDADRVNAALSRAINETYKLV